VSYEWDPDKARENIAKHGVPFAEASSVLEDDFALTMRDPFSEEEERWITLGRNEAGRLLVVVYSWRGSDIRLISARPATEGRGLNTRNTMKREYDFSKARRGAVVPVPKGKTRITIRLDDEILGWFREQVERAGGGSYQAMINEVLQQHMRHSREPLEKTLRRVIREELGRAS
jgi:uncharacterized DUF497 family protein/predicted DNA binding CopG/RHH family protein